MVLSVVLLPFAASAHGIEVEASADSGGNRVSSGMSVHTGDSNASVSVRSLSDDNSSSTVEIETEHGVTFTKTHGGRDFSVRALASSTATSSGFFIEQHGGDGRVFRFASTTLSSTTLAALASSTEDNAHRGSDDSSSHSSSSNGGNNNRGVPGWLSQIFHLFGF